ncbi:uncharacterized protein LOC124286090 [Haliotis rubra]|uniref:uncharacterized protein LOC124286090 n=1 Tax=Haliotis rubra TaxID=36100 RepID=UPI001EE5B374|nr:uncharacterized protein LOC124286090 [Haliotis rubra]XP_046578372.1 uncharacterized protein LOC124286090 [Haliotis rubra]
MFKHLVCVVVAVISWRDVTCAANNSVTLDLTHDCDNRLYRVDYTQNFIVEGNTSARSARGAWWDAKGGRCEVSFETTQDKGICINVYELDLLPYVTIDFKTTTYRPDKRYRRGESTGEWCTHKNLLTMEITMKGRERKRDSFQFGLDVRNKTLDKIEREYNMGSATDCNMGYTLRETETAIVKSHKVQIFDQPPQDCEMTFTTQSKAEYGQVCVTVKKFKPRYGCHMGLALSKLDKNHWPAKVIYDCKTKKESTKEVCSSNKVLVIKLERGNESHSVANFELTVASKLMPFWESMESQKTELSVMRAAKSLTVVIATFDTVFALMAAFISIATRYPYGRLKVFGDVFGKDPIPAHYGNEYPVAIAVTTGESEPPPF